MNLDLESNRQTPGRDITPNEWMNNIMLLLLILERPQRAECHLSLVNVTEHLSHKQQSLLSEFKRIHTRDDHALEIYYDVKI